MSTAPSLTQSQVPPLFNGDRMNQAEFHRRYEAYPEDVKFARIAQRSSE
jgi:hypothetical protein